jgi:hypothetical protein
MPRDAPHQSIRHVGGLRRLLLRRSPLEDVVAIDAEAEEIRGDEAGLLGLKADITNDDAVGGGDDPSLPVSFADEDRGADSKNTRNVIKTHDKEDRPAKTYLIYGREGIRHM